MLTLSPISVGDRLLADTIGTVSDDRKILPLRQHQGKLPPIEPVETSQEPVPDNGGVRLTTDGKIEGVGKEEALLEGNVIVEKEDKVLNANKVFYRNNKVLVPELFKLRDRNNLLVGRRLEYDLNTGLGLMEDFRLNSQGRSNPFQGEGEKLEILQNNFYHLQKARVNTCDPGDDSWYLEAEHIKLDYERNVGVAKNTKLIFKGVPLMVVPWFDFPLNGRRKSGFLSPIVGVKSGNGFEFGLPYYSNLAPNYDMTITPHIYTKRGFGVDGEFRYLANNFTGFLAGSFLPNDKVAKREMEKSNRYAISFRHWHSLTSRLFLGIDYNQVSDNYYFKDFGNRSASAENNNLNRQIWLSYDDQVAGGPLSVFLTVQNYQTLQNKNSTIGEPYRLQPQLSLKWSKLTRTDTEVDLLTQVSNFKHRNKPTGIRGLIYPSITWNFFNDWGFLRPKLGLHSTYYQLDNYRAVANDGTEIHLPRRNFSRVLPIFSVDGGLIFERPWQFRGKNFVQTLEPRFFYTYIPNKEQDHLPNFDSERVDTTFPNLFRENRFTGHDRINAANDLSYGLVSRFYHKNSGVEAFRAGMGQRIYLKKDNVSLDNKANPNRKNYSDTFVFAQGEITDKISLQTDLYFSGNRKTDNRYMLGLLYDADLGKSMSLRYKYNQNSIWLKHQNKQFAQVDLSFQWPLTKRYSVLGKYSYSVPDKKLLEALVGVEYLNECQCWGFNTVYQTYVTEYNKRKNAVFFQLNLRGLGGLGVNPFGELYRAIPGYRPRNEVK